MYDYLPQTMYHIMATKSCCDGKNTTLIPPQLRKKLQGLTFDTTWKNFRVSTQTLSNVKPW